MTILLVEVTSTGAKLINKGSVAVDPAIIPYFSTVKIPEAGIEAVSNDTGSAVVSRKASRENNSNAPVVDLFFDKKKDAQYFADNNPMFVNYLKLKHRGLQDACAIYNAIG
jgi:3D (Asp-Asp-Asp) domain-containing protein